MTLSNQAIDTFLSQPQPLLIAVVFGACAVVALLVHFILVPRLAGRDGTRMEGFEAEVVALISFAFGLLISFNAVSVWQNADTADAAVTQEAAALQEVAYEFDLLSSPQARQEGRAALSRYVEHLINTEWPLLASSLARTDRPPAQAALLAISRSLDSEPLTEALSRAMEARIDRIQASHYRISRARWVVVILLAILLISAMGLLHARHRRSRVAALSFVSLAIGTCFVILFAHGRPFIGEEAIQPVSLRELATRLNAP